MTLEFLHEHPVISWKALPCMVPGLKKTVSGAFPTTLFHFLSV